MAFTWAAGCGGCEASLLDLGPEWLGLTEKVEIVYWPVALDHKRERLEKLTDGELLAAWINGAVRTAAQEEMAKLLRRKARLIVAHGTCAHLGGVLGLANRPSEAEAPGPTLGNWAKIEDPKGIESGSGPAIPFPGLPDLKSRVLPLDRVIAVDYIVPGCPPPPGLNSQALSVILEGPLPPRGTVLAGKKALCRDCPRRESRPEEIRWTRVVRLHQNIWDPHRCFLAEGIPCLGPATRGDCGSRCLRANRPCRGCFGPLDGVGDPGARVVAFLASLLDGPEERDLEALLDTIPDPLGLAYFYSLAASELFGDAPHKIHDETD
jgi:F420-non-reducing hydrogenase small subunit